MAYHVQLSLPRIVQRGVAATLTCPVYNDAGAEQTASAGTVAIYDGGAEVLAATAVTTTGPPASYSLAASVTTDRGLTDRWHEEWSLTGLDTFRITGFLVRHAYHDRLTDSVLQDAHPEFLDHLPPVETTGERFRRTASERIQRRLLAKGRRPHLIFNADALLDPAIFLALHLWADDVALRSDSETRWIRLADRYMKQYESAWSEVTFDYDRDEDGLIDPSEQGEATQSASIVFTAGRRRAGRGGWR